MHVTPVFFVRKEVVRCNDGWLPKWREENTLERWWEEEEEAGRNGESIVDAVDADIDDADEVDADDVDGESEGSEEDGSKRSFSCMRTW